MSDAGDAPAAAEGAPATPPRAAGRVLVVDDEAGIRSVLQDVLGDEGYDVETVEDGPQALARLGLGDDDGLGIDARRDDLPDLVILDVWLPDMGGIDVLGVLRERVADLPVVMISGHASIDVAVRAVKMGAFDFLEKPLSLDRTTTVVRNALRQTDLVRENQQLRRSLLNEDDMVGDSPALELVRERVAQSAAVDATVLITGENGTGKELVAKQIHLASARAARPFVEVNCAAIPDALIESELFGHERGAFTGAVAQRIGKFESAHGGTLFLDEIGDMSLATQAKILRAIQEMRFSRVGGERSIQVDVRVVAATNRDLVEEVAAGRFREDLYYRLNVVPIAVPALRERPDDLPALCRYFLRKFADTTGRELRVLQEGAMAVLAAHAWPGNIRELKNFVERVTIMNEGAHVSAADAAVLLGAPGDTPAPADALGQLPGLDPAASLAEARDWFERCYVERALLGSSPAEAARELGISVSNLHNKIRKYGIERRAASAP
mgnify:CR=1 FL=1